MKLFELRRDLAAKQLEGRAIVEKAIGESRPGTPEEEVKIEAVRAEIRDLISKINLFEARDSFEALSSEERAEGGRLGPDLPELDGKRPYSLLRALSMALDVREGKAKYSGLEYEVHCELAKHRERAQPCRAKALSAAARLLSD